jgi:hypothetical protein
MRLVHCTACDFTWRSRTSANAVDAYHVERNEKIERLKREKAKKRDKIEKRAKKKEDTKMKGKK